MTEFTQNKNILEFLKAKNKIDTFTARHMFDCERLAARIHDLRKAGNCILTETVKLKSGKRVARYSLIS